MKVHPPDGNLYQFISGFWSIGVMESRDFGFRISDCRFRIGAIPFRFYSEPQFPIRNPKSAIGMLQYSTTEKFKNSTQQLINFFINNSALN